MDFVSEHSDDFIGYLCGHQHSDWVRGYPIATISHVCGLRTGWRDLKDLWSVIVVDKTNEVIRLIRFGQNGAWSNRRSGDYLVHYNQTVLELNEDATLELSIDNTNVTWGMVSSSWATFATNPVRFASNFDAATQEPFPASEVLSMTPSQDNGSCTVEVIDQKADHPRCVTVYARNNSMVEYWHIKIPQLTT